MPFDAGGILEILRKGEPEAANDPRNGDHTNFWLVVADQFHKKGLDSEEATRKAISLIDAGADHAMLQELGMTAANLRKRKATLAKLRERLESETSSVRRGPLKKPESLVMAIGDVLVYPTCRGASFNPYFRPGEEERLSGRTQDAWGAMPIVNAGLAFDYLAWYTIMVAKNEFDDKPTMSVLMRSPWTLRASGTCSAGHFRRMRLEVIGKVAIDRKIIENAFGTLESGEGAAVSDISIGNHTGVVSKNPGVYRFVQPNMERARSLELREFAAEIS